MVRLDLESYRGTSLSLPVLPTQGVAILRGCFFKNFSGAELHFTAKKAHRYLHPGDSTMGFTEALRTFNIAGLCSRITR